MEFIWFCLISYGLTQILVYSKILNKIRPTEGIIGSFASCPMCVGFWVGVFLWYLRVHTKLFNFDDSIATAFLCGCAASASAYVFSMLFGDNGLRIEKLICTEKEKI